MNRSQLARLALGATPLALSTVLAACGASAPRDEGSAPQTQTAGASAPRDEGSGRPTQTAGESAPDPRRLCSGACSMGDACPGASIEWRCTCELHEDVNCGGAPRDPGPGWWAWTCSPIDPAADRGDGCPAREPEGGPCASGASCRYDQGACGREITEWSCVGGQWTPTGHVSLPDPP